MVHSIVGSTRAAAIRKGNRWALTIEQAWALMQRPCYICSSKGTPYQLQGMAVRMRRNGIDRIDNSKGYVRGNVAPCCTTCNRIKSDFELGSLLCHLKKMVTGLRQRQLVAKRRSL